MKKKTTKKTINNNYTNIFKCGYCDLQYIFRDEEPTHYLSGTYGWDCDVYTDLEKDMAITTGYRNMVGKLIPSELIYKYEINAREILHSTKPYEEIKKELKANKEEFLDELLNL